MDQFSERAYALHKQARGKIKTTLSVPLDTREDLALAYTPGVGHVATCIAQNPKLVDELTNRHNTVAIVSDGSAVLGLGNIGPLGALPVMEGKAALFKRFANIDAVPIVLSTQDPDQIIAAVTAMAPSFGGINLEDIAAPHCFVIEQVLQKKLSIPVFHDDQHGTAIVVLAGLINACAVVGVDYKQAPIVINGAGAAGLAIFELLWHAGCRSIAVVDSKGVLSNDRADLNAYKKDVAQKTNASKGSLHDVLNGAQVFIGVSTGNILQSEDIALMAKEAIVFAMANPTPEIMPDDAHKGGARVVATGRSDFPNQINNALVFPGLFRGALDYGVEQITIDHMYRAAHAVAGLVEYPNQDCIVPDIFDPRLTSAVAKIFSTDMVQSAA